MQPAADEAKAAPPADEVRFSRATSLVSHDGLVYEAGINVKGMREDEIISLFELVKAEQHYQIPISERKRPGA